jgi:hypothetical protein
MAAMQRTRTMRQALVGTAAVLLPIVLLLCAHSASAAQTQCAVTTIASSQQAVDEIARLLDEQCLGGQGCQSAECKLVATLVSENPGKAGVTDPKRRQEVADRIFIVLQRLHARAMELDADNRPLGVLQLRGMLERWAMPTLGETRDAAIERLTQANKLEWQGSGMDLFLNTPFYIDLNMAFQTCDVDLQHCTPTPLCASAVQCDMHYKSVVEVYTISGLIHRTLDVAVADGLEDLGKMLKTFDARWSTYHSGSLALFPWELIVNNLFYKSAKAGFSGPPSYQWLVLHPSVAVAYDDSQEDKMQEAILLDVIGRYRWTWGGKDGAQVTKPFGVALAMSWSGDDPGYGLAVHLPRNWSIGVTRNKDDHTQLLFSVEFGQYVTDKQKSVEVIRKQLEDQRF